MNEKTDANPYAGAGARGCERSDELVTYLYGEATKEEARLFRLHLDSCAVCREEVAALGGVREAVGFWRAEALNSIPALKIEESLAPAANVRPADVEERLAADVRLAATRVRSARAALREFFSLSPVWLRACAFASVLAFVALAALTLARAEVRWGADGLAFRAGGSERVVKEEVRVPVQTGYTDEQVNELVARKVAEARAQFASEAKEQTNEPRPEEIVNVSGVVNRQSQKPAASNAQTRKRTTRAGARRDEPLLADDNLPRLSDLLSGSY